MFDYKRLEASDIQAYESLAFPRWRKLLAQVDTAAEAAAIGAELFAEPVGLILYSFNHKNENAYLHSIYVRPKYRRMGIATRLVQLMERHAASKQIHTVQCDYIAEEEKGSALEEMLRKLQWGLPANPLVTFRISTASMFQDRWIHEYGLPGNIALFPWHELKDEERREIEQGQDRWYPVNLTPFRRENLFDPGLSMGLRYQGRVAGWFTMYLHDSQTAVCDSLFTIDELQSRGRGLYLMCESIKRMHARNIPYGMFHVNTKNKLMLKFVERRMKPHILQTAVHCQSVKRLSPEASSNNGSEK